MQEHLTNIQCPACGGPVTFSPDTGLMHCDFCGGDFDPSEVDGATNPPIKSETTTDDSCWNVVGNQNSDWLAAMSVASCPSCGSVIATDPLQVTTRCPWCDNYTVATGKLEGVGAPDFVLPFRITRENAILQLDSFFSTRPLLPRAFKSKKHLKEVHGIYVPFFLFSGKVDEAATFKAENSTSGRAGDYIQITTENYKLIREGSMCFSHIPADASQGMEDALMDSIEPYDFSELVSFNPAYLSGFEAEVNSDSAASCAKRAEHRAVHTLRHETSKHTAGFDSVFGSSFSETFHREKVHYALLPVWILTTLYGGKCYHYAINGQTGKAAGDVPVGIGAVIKLGLLYFLKPTLITMAALLAFLFLGFFL